MFRITKTVATTDAQNTGCPDPTVLCFPDLNGNLSDLITTNGTTVPATAPFPPLRRDRSLSPSYEGGSGGFFR